MDKLEKLLELGTESEKTELKVVQNAKVANLKAYNEGRSASDLRNYEAADDKLTRLIEQLWNKYFKEEPSFGSIMEVAKHLMAQGYAVKKSKVYGDAKKGLLRIEPTGRINEISVRAYAAGLDKKGAVTVEDIEERTIRKLEAEIRRLDIQNRSTQFDLDTKMGKFMLRIEFDMEMAARVAVLYAGQRSYIQAKAGDIIDLVGGDLSRVGDLIDFMIKGQDGLMNDYADVERFQVMLGDDCKTNIE